MIKTVVEGSISAMDKLHFVDESSEVQLMEKNDLSRVKYLPGNDLSNASLEALVDIDTPAAQTETVYDEKIPVVDDSITEEDRQAFINELQRFYVMRSGSCIKIPIFYKQPLNCLKLWRMVNNLGGYEQVELHNLWRKVGDTFNPPMSCTTIRCTFRNFYRKVLLDYEMHLRQAVDCKGGEVIWRTPAHSKKEVNSDLLADENLKTGMHLGYEVSHVGLRAERVKVNVQATKSSFEVYVLIPGLRPEEVHVQAHSDGILIINGQPQELNGPWGIRPFKKIVRVPGRIDPMQMKAELSTVGTMRISMPYLEILRQAGPSCSFVLTS